MGNVLSTFLIFSSVHPATWFKVVFPPETKVVTFRPSALQAVDDEGRPFSSYVVKSTFSRTSYGASGRSLEPPVTKTSQNKARMQTSDLSMNPKLSSAPRKRPSSNAMPNTLSFSSMDPETWLGRKVVIVIGRYSGQVGIVRGVGSGWLQLETPVGDISKRAAEILLFEGEDNDLTSLEGESGSLDDDSYDFDGSRRKRRMSAMEGAASFMSNAVKRPKRVRKVSDGTDYDSGADDDDMLQSYGVVHSSKNTFIAMSSSTCKEAPRDPMASALPLDPALYSYPILTESDGVRARRGNLQQYVRNVQLSCCHRPNLSDWKSKLNASLFRFSADFASPGVESISSNGSAGMSFLEPPSFVMTITPPGSDASSTCQSKECRYFVADVSSPFGSEYEMHEAVAMQEEESQESETSSFVPSSSSESLSSHESHQHSRFHTLRDLEYKAMVSSTAKRQVIQEKWQDKLKNKFLPYGHVTAKEVHHIA